MTHRQRLSEEEQIALAIKVSQEEQGTKKGPAAAVPPQPTKPAPPTPIASQQPAEKILPKTADVPEEQRREWKRCSEEGPTILDAKEMHYRDLLALLHNPWRRVILSKRQVVELHDHETITGCIIIIPEGFIEYLRRLVHKLRRKLRDAERKIHHLEEEVARQHEEIERLKEEIKELQGILAVLRKEVECVERENTRLIEQVEKLTRIVAELTKQVEQKDHRIEELVKEAQYWKDKYEHEKHRNERLERWLWKCHEECKDLRAAYDCRRKEIVDILMKPLPKCENEEIEAMRKKDTEGL